MNISAKKGIFLKILGLCLISALIGGVVVYASLPSSTLVLTGGIYPRSPSYSVFKDGSEYFVKTEMGLIADSDTDFNDLFDGVLALCSGGEQIYIKSGDYAVDGTSRIWVNVSVSIIGEGAGSTRLYDNVGSTVEWFTVHASNVLIEGLTFDANHLSEAMFHIKRVSGDSDIYNVVVRDCIFKNMPTGHDAGGLVTVWDTEEDFRLYDVTFDSCVLTNDDEITYDNVAVSWVKGVTFQDCYINLSKTFILYNAIDCLIADNTFEHFHSYGSLVVGGYGNVVSNNVFNCSVPIRINDENLDSQGFNVFEGNYVIGTYVYVTQTSATVHGNVITGNVFFNSSEGGLYIAPTLANMANYNVVVGNVFNYTDGHGIVVSNSSGNIIADNVLVNIGVGSGTFYGIRVLGSENNTITGNVLDDIDAEGIYLSDSSYNIVDGNRVNSYSTAIVDAGTSDYNMISNNIAFKESGGDDITVTGGNTVEDNNIEL